MIFGSPRQQTEPWVTFTNSGFANTYVPPRREPNFEPPASLKMLEGRIWSWDLQRAIRILLTALMTLSRFTRWALAEIRRWLHAALAAPPMPAFERLGRVCSLGSAYRVRGPPSYCPAGSGC